MLNGIGVAFCQHRVCVGVGSTWLKHATTRPTRRIGPRLPLGPCICCVLCVLVLVGKKGRGRHGSGNGNPVACIPYRSFHRGWYRIRELWCSEVGRLPSRSTLHGGKLLGRKLCGKLRLARRTRQNLWSIPLVAFPRETRKWPTWIDFCWIGSESSTLLLFSFYIAGLPSSHIVHLGHAAR